jgi:hypothetical protein
VLIVTLRAERPALSDDAARQLRAALCRAASGRLWIVSDADLRNFFTADGLPDRAWTRDDVVQFGRQLRTDIVGELAATDSAGHVQLSLDLFRPGSPASQHSLRRVADPRMKDAAAVLAAHMIADSTFQAMARASHN